ncbi:MAG: hypothetical protein IJK84_00905 [Bacteroidales bacterium]|nr:hypothetical protein [Bacteroidales bacterium]
MSEKTIIQAPKEDSRAQQRLVDKMYLSAVKNRLSQLNNPSDNDCKRWVWELIQNAKDTIAKDPSRSSIDVKIEIEGDTVRFRHNGNPFTADARLGLLYKYSDDKENQESTGRFGTGFLTTHCLSKVVNVESNMYTNEGLCGFSVTMYRDGLTDSELLNGLEKMRDSNVFYKETFEWTTFTYRVSSETGRKAIKLGIENFHENIAQTMLFCKELSSVVLDDNGKITTIVRKPTVCLMDDIILSEFIISGDTSITRRFIHTSYSGYNEELSNRYRAVRNIRIDAAIEIDSENKLVTNENKTSFFCVMPLVGIEAQLNEPLIINSPDFEPDPERQSLYLSGITWNEEKDVITENGINRAIYEQVFPLYTKLVKYLTDNQFGRLYYLANGLDRTKKHEKLDHDWYKPNVIDKYREILMQYPVAEAQDGSGYMKLGECIIVKELVQKDEDKIYNLLKSVYPAKLINNNHEWSEYLWKDGLSIWSTETLCSEIEQKANWTTIDLTGTELAVWYNDFLAHVLVYNELFLKEHALLPNMNGDLLKKGQEDFKQGEHINTFVIGLLSSLGKDVKPTLLHEEITSVSFDSKYNSQSYSADINKLAKAIIDDEKELHKVNKLLPLLSVVPDDAQKYKPEFLSRRKEFFEICKALYQLNDATVSCDNNLLEGAWKETDEWLVTNILNSLNTLGCLSKLPEGLDAKWLNSTIKSLNVKTDKLNIYAVLPNQNGTFCCQKDLYEDSGVPEELKDSIFDTIGINYKDILLHEDIVASDFAVVQKKTISSFASELNDAATESSNKYLGNEFNGSYHKYSKDILYGIASYMIRLLPENKETNLYQNQSSLLSIAQAFGLAGCLIGYVKFENKNLWDKISFYTACKIWEKIEEFSTITELCAFLKKGESDVIQLLNSYYAYQEYADINFDSHKIIPNQNGDLRSKDDLYKEEGDINDDLKTIINNLSKVDDNVVDLRSQLVDKRVFIKLEKVLNEKYAYNLIDESIDRLYQIPAKWEDENYITASQMLIEKWGDKHKGLFEENFPRVFPTKEKVLMNVVWKKEKRELMMAVSTQLSEEELTAIIENSAEISVLSSKVKALETENEILKKRLAELGISISGDDVTFGIGLNGSEVATVQQIAESNEAKQLVFQKLEKEGFDVSKADSEYSVIHGVVRNDVNYPLVVKSCKNQEHRVWINPDEWQQLFKPNSMLWLHFGEGVVAPIKAHELFTYQDKLTLSFDTVNLMMDDRIHKIMEVLHYFNKVKLDLVTLNPNKHRADNLNDYLFSDNNADNSDLDDRVAL